MISLFNQIKDIIKIISPAAIIIISIILSAGLIKACFKAIESFSIISKSWIGILLFLVILILFGFLYFKYVNPLL